MAIVKTKKSHAGFTIVELLIVIVVIGILAAITVVAFNGVQNRAQASARATDAMALLKAIALARENNNTTLMGVTGSTWSQGFCTSSANNTGLVEPKNLPTSHVCWQRYYNNLSLIGAASGINLDALRGGDQRGNPYVWDENEGESADANLYCRSDSNILYFTGSGTTVANVKPIPKQFSPAISCP